MTKGNAELVRRYEADLTAKRERIEKITVEEIESRRADCIVLASAIAKLKLRS